MQVLRIIAVMDAAMLRRLEEIHVILIFLKWKLDLPVLIILLNNNSILGDIRKSDLVVCDA